MAALMFFYEDDDDAPKNNNQRKSPFVFLFVVWIEEMEKGEDPLRKREVPL